MSKEEYPVEIFPIDITPYKDSNTGIDYITSFDSGQPGPHVMVSALTHGNEICGAITLDFLLRQQLRPIIGKLTLAFMNHAAYHTFDPKAPSQSRFVDEDMNRVWSEETLLGERTSLELERARAIAPLLDQVDFLLDIHSMQHKTVPLMLSGALDKGRDLAKAVGSPVTVVRDPGHAAGKRMRDYQGFGDPASPKNALLIECGQHWEKNSEIYSQEITLRFLNHLGVIDPDFVNQHLSRQPLEPQQVINVSGPVTIETNEFRFAEKFIGLEVLEEKGSLIGWDGDKEIRTPFDNCVLIMPSRRLTNNIGASAVRLGRLES